MKKIERTGPTMLKVTNLKKTFGDYTAVSDMNLTLDKGVILGLIGSNGAGKSTIIRMLTGVYLPNGGTVEYDGQAVYDNVAVKRNIFYFPDELYFAGATVKDTANFYKHFFPNFSCDLFYELCSSFNLKKSQAIMACSKGMKRQVMMNAAIASNVQYIYLDEAFDGLDAVARQTYIKLFVELAHEKGTDIIVATHNIREIDHFCDRLCLLYKSNIIADTTPDELVEKRTRAVVEFDPTFYVDTFIKENVSTYTKKGDKYTLTFDKKKDEAKTIINNANPKSVEYLAMTLEDSFVCELEASGYEIKSVDVV